MKNAVLKKPAWKAAFLYAGVVILLFCLVGTTAFLNAARLQGVYFFTQLCFLGLGMLHAWLLYRFLYFLDESSFLQGTLATLAIALLGAVGLVAFLIFLGPAATIPFYVSCVLL